METVVIQTRLISYSEKNVMVELIMWNENKTTLKSLMWTKFSHFNLMAKKSEIHSEKFMELFREVMVPLHVKSFEERVEELKGR